MVHIPKLTFSKKEVNGMQLWSNEVFAKPKPLTKQGRRIVRNFNKKVSHKFTFTETHYDSLSTNRIRQRLFDLMGTDVIRLNDTRYFKKLSTKLREEYESEMHKEELARMESENERILRLMTEGIIPDPYDYRARVHNEHRQQKRTKKKKRKRKKRLNWKKRPKVCKEKEATRPVTVRGSEKQPFSDDEESSPEDEYDTETKSLPESRPQKYRWKYAKTENPLVDRLRREETVAGLYAIAKKLISPIKAGENAYKRPPRAPKKKKMTVQYLKY